MNYRFLLLVILSITVFQTKSQILPFIGQESSKKGQFFVYWGNNRDWFSNSNIHFKGDDYNFVVKDVVAKDRQTPFSPDIYFRLRSVTIPQYNLRLGYYFKPKLSISIGIDHMKYVVKQNQQADATGYIGIPDSPYKGNYSKTPVILTEDFLKFEHTDGLNYINIEMRQVDNAITYRKFKLDLIHGAGFGMLLPRTNTTLLGKERYDEFHISGYGMGAVVGINFMFYDWLFIQTELKGGYINMPDIRTTSSIADKANQTFYYLQYNVLLGTQFSLSNKAKQIN